MINNEKKYIKQLVLSNSSSEHILQFLPGVNVIIGTKGGGKSTLLKILYGLHANYSNYDSDIDQIAKTFGFNVDKLVYSNGDIKRWRDKRTKYPKDEQRNDIIIQDDKIKKELDTAATFKKEKNRFLEKSCKIVAKDLSIFFDGYFKTFHELNQLLKNLNELNIHDLFQLKNDRNKRLLEQIQKLLVNSLNRTQEKNNKWVIKVHTDLYSILRHYLNKVIEHKPRSGEIELISNQDYEKIIETVLSLLKLHTRSIFDKSLDNIKYDAVTNTIKDYEQYLKDSQETDRRIGSFSSALEEKFKSIARVLANNFAYFDNFLDQKFSKIPIKNKAKSENDPDIQFEIDLEYDLGETSEEDPPLYKIFSKCLYKPSVFTDKVKWLNNFLQKGGFKDNKYDLDDDEILLQTLEKYFEENLQNKITVLLDGKDYEKLSLGTRSSYGVSRVIKNCQSSILFLDQPEDNIDSYTIAKTLIPAIKENDKIGQVFIITHNSNTGILTDPQTTTVCSFRTNDIQNSYRQSNLTDKLEIIEDEVVNENASAHYLEGGIQALEERHSILVNKKRRWWK